MSTAETAQVQTECVACGTLISIAPDAQIATYPTCKPCSRRYPYSLIKAVCDEFDYALRLRTGDVIRFTTATIRGDYATLTVDGSKRLDYEFPRGLDVRIEDIVWCADAPEGS